MDLEHLLSTAKEYNAPASLKAQAFLSNYQAEYRLSIDNPFGFWGTWAQRFSWFQHWNTVLEWNFPDHKWFVGAKTNITWNCLDRHADGANRNKLALIWIGEDGTERKVTYGELRNMVSRFATGLKASGVEKGDRVIIYMPLTVEGVIAMLACARIGAVHSVVYAGLGVAALKDRILDAGAKVVIAGDLAYRRGKKVDLRSIVEQATADLPLHKIIWFQRKAKAELTRREADFDEMLWAFRPETPPEPLDSEHPLFILYTSGSTGKPRGVVHVHGGYMVGTTYHFRTFFDVKDGDIFWSTSDIGWIVGHSYIVYAPLVEGVTSLMREGAPDFPNPGAVWQIVERFGVNVMFTAPTAVRMFMKFGSEWPKKYDLSTLRLLTVAGEPLNPEAWRWAYEHLVDEGRTGFVVDNWWQTELGGPTIGTPLTLPAKPGSAGVALPGVQAGVVDAQGKDVGPGKGGNFVLKNPFPHMMRAVWGQPERYREYFTLFPGNVYAAGDVVTVDADGYYTFLGRSDDVLNVAGHRIGTADVESAFVSHKSVAEAAVVGVPDPIKGESIKAFVILRAGRVANEDLKDALIAHVRRELGAIATPSELNFVDKLPKTRSGKILRRVLKAQALGIDPGDISTIEE